MTEPIGCFALGLVTIHVGSHAVKDRRRLIGGLILAAGVLECVVGMILAIGLLAEKTT